MKSFILKIVLISGLFLVISCDITKSASKTKLDTSLKDDLETKRLRKGDSVGYYPDRNIILKDTTIYRVSKENTVLRTVYDSSGNISSVECTAAQIEELTRRNILLEQEVKQKDSTKEENFDSSFILYIIIGIVVLGMFAMILMFVLINKNTKAVTTVLQQLQK